MSSVGHEPAAAELAASWARTLSGLRESSVQVGWVRAQLVLLGAARAADVLTVVLARAQQREERYATLLLRVSLALCGESTAQLRRAIAGVAQVRGQDSLAQFLGAAEDPDESAATEPAETEEKGPKRDIPDFGKGRPLSLGERKSIARQRDRNVLARVIRDPHPDVIRILLDNPALVEEDVVRLCARRPVPSQVLTQVFQHPRWILRYRIRLTLALNPHTPEHVALQMLPHLGPADLREVAQSGQISERVRAACFERSDRLLH
jgi:hypothetical protein